MGSFPETYSDLKFSSLISILFRKKIGGENLTKKSEHFPFGCHFSDSHNLAIS